MIFCQGAVFLLITIITKQKWEKKMKIFTAVVLVLTVCPAGLSFAEETKKPIMLTDTQMDKVVAGNHVIRLVQLRSGRLLLPTTAAEDALTRAGYILGAGNDRPAIVGLLR
jgi:hypothetical protein